MRLHAVRFNITGVGIACLLLALVFWPGVAMAQAVAAPASPWWVPLIGQLTQALLVPLLLLASGTLLGLIVKGFAWLKTHTLIANNAWANGVKDRFLGIVQNLTLAEVQTSVDAIKAKQAAGGFQTPADYKAALEGVKTGVIAKAKEHASAQGIIGDLETVLGVGTPGSTATVDSFADTLIESVLAHYKLSNPMTNAMVEATTKAIVSAVPALQVPPTPVAPTPAPAPAAA